MVRVAGLKRRIDTGIAVTAASGLSPRQQLRAISEQAHRLQDEHAHYVIDHILPALAKEQIVLLSWDKLTRGRAGAPLALLPSAGVPRTHAACRGSGPPVPLHFRRFAQPRRAGGEPDIRQVPLRPREDPGNLNRLVPVDDLTEEESTDVRYGFITMENLIIATWNPCSRA